MYKNVKYESRRINKRKNFSTKEADLIDLLETPLNILKVGVLRSMVVRGVRQKVWLPSGEEILKKWHSIVEIRFTPPSKSV